MRGTGSLRGSIARDKIPRSILWPGMGTSWSLWRSRHGRQQSLAARIVQSIVKSSVTFFELRAVLSRARAIPGAPCVLTLSRLFSAMRPRFRTIAMYSSMVEPWTDSFNQRLDELVPHSGLPRLTFLCQKD